MSEKHLTILLTDGAHGHTHTHTPKRNGPRGSLFGPSAQREGELGEQSLAGYLPALCGHTGLQPTRWDSNPRPEIHGSTTLAARPPPPRGATAKDRRPRPRPSHHDRPKAIGHDHCSTLVLTTTLLFLFSGHSPPDWTRGCRAISGLPSLVGPNTLSG